MCRHWRTREQETASYDQQSCESSFSHPEVLETAANLQVSWYVATQEGQLQRQSGCPLQWPQSILEVWSTAFVGDSLAKAIELE
jgi:hypothetical protein